jgi:hypothetical protein
VPESVRYRRPGEVRRILFKVGGLGVLEVREEVLESGKVGEDFYPRYPPIFQHHKRDKFWLEYLSNLATLYTSSQNSNPPGPPT